MIAEDWQIHLTDILQTGWWKSVIVLLEKKEEEDYSF